MKAPNIKGPKRLCDLTCDLLFEFICKNPIISDIKLITRDQIIMRFGLLMVRYFVWFSTITELLKINLRSF